MLLTTYQKNKVIPQNKVLEGFNLFNQIGQLVYPESKRIYHNLYRTLSKGSILEAGCGIGYGISLLERQGRIVTATDKESSCIKFITEIYPWLKTDIWDITEDPYLPHDIVIAIEVIEHVEDIDIAIENLKLTACKELWISTPNRNNPGIDKDKPKNIHHVKEYTPEEMIDLIGDCEIMNWYNFEIVSEKTKITPLIYRVKI